MLVGCGDMPMITHVVEGQNGNMHVDVDVDVLKWIGVSLLLN